MILDGIVSALEKRGLISKMRASSVNAEQSIVAIPVNGITIPAHETRNKKTKRRMSAYRPGNILAISAQRFPTVTCDSRIVRSSSSFQGCLEMSGFKWLCHRSRHCFPIRPGRFDAINDHFFAPYFLTSSTTFRSSSAVHGPLMRDGFNTFCHR